MVVQRGLSKSTRKVVVKNHLQGLDESENVKSSSSSSGGALTTGEINSVINEFESEVGKKGLEAVSKDYGVSNIAKDLWEVASFKRKNKIEFSSMLEGAKIASALKKFGAGMPEFEQFLNSVYTRSLEKGYTPNEIISQSAKLEALEKKYGMKFDSLKASYEDIGKSLVSRKKEKIDLEAGIAQLSQRKTDLMTRFAVDEQKILDYANTKQQLALVGLDVKNLKDLRNFFVNLKNEKFEPKEIIGKLNSITDLQSQIVRVQQEVKIAKQDLDEKKSLLEEIKRLEESKLTVEQVERMRSLIVKISSDHKVDSLQAYNRFEQDILQSYNTILGLRPETSRLEENKKRIEAEISAKRKDLESIEAAASDKIRKLDEKYSKQREEIEAYNELRALGIDGKRMLSWNQIIKSANLDFGTIEGELRNQANLKGLEDKTSAKIKELVTEELRLSQSISQLNQEKQKIESSILAMKESALSGIGEVSSKILTSISTLKEQAEERLAETASNSQKSLEDLRNSTQQQIKQVSDSALSDLKTTVSELKSSAEDFSKELRNSIEAAAPEIKNVGLALEAGEKLGKYRNILPLLQLIDGSGGGDESEALIAMWNLTSRFNAWLENHYPGSKKDISEPLAKLLESINDEIQRVGGD
jgi:hypothetical protein